jgi:hypothetical protein
MENSPLSDLHDAMQATWRADIAVEEAARHDLSGKSVDRAAVAKTLRAEAANTEAALTAAVRHTALLRRNLAAMPEGSMKQGIFRALDSIGDTVKSFHEVSAAWLTIADLMDDPKSDGWAWVRATAKIQDPLAAIAAQAVERRRLMGGAL